MWRRNKIVKEDAWDITVIKHVTKSYLESSQFNGTSAEIFLTKDISIKELKNRLSYLIKTKKIVLVFGDKHPNPYIKAFPEDPITEQIEKLENSNLKNVCVYPAPEYLAKVVRRDKYSSRPFTLRLALGEPQLKPIFFELQVLEYYRNDPRFNFTNSDIDGSISFQDAYSGSGHKRDEVFIQTFGFGYDEKMNRAVAVFLRYLTALSPEHQQIWNAKILDGNYKLHPDYYRASILGEWPERVSIFCAFLEEQMVINRMAKAMGRKPLFNKTFEWEEKPRDFSFLTRPTLKEFNGFVHLLDKLLSDNLNKDFFAGEISDKEYENEHTVRQKGTLKMLEEWILKRFRIPDKKPLEEAFKTLRKIRAMRSSPVHSIKEDVFDQKYFREQRELIIEAYSAVRLIRLIFANHPKARGVKIEELVSDGKIWTY